MSTTPASRGRRESQPAASPQYPDGTVGNSWYRRFGKRWLDAVMSLVGLGLATAPLLVIAVLSRAIQGSPVLFTQERIGRYGGRFVVWKFRTMGLQSGDGNPITVAGDQRVTAWGRFLRRFKLDELPQLVCVLSGKMSFVGPRPDVPGYWDRLGEPDRHLLQLRPGITGPATLVFRDEELLLARSSDPTAFNDRVLFPEKIRLNERYYREMSFVSDIKWIIYTILPGRLLRRLLERGNWVHHLEDDLGN